METVDCGIPETPVVPELLMPERSGYPLQGTALRPHTELGEGPDKHKTIFFSNHQSCHEKKFFDQQMIFFFLAYECDRSTSAWTLEHIAYVGNVVLDFKRL